MPTSVFVTGASSGIGRSFVQATPSSMNTPHTFSRRDGGTNWHQVDLAHPRQWPVVFETFDDVLDQERPDHAIFFHCSGATDPVGRVVDIDPVAYAHAVTMNAASGMSLGQAFLRACHARGIRATLVLASSPAAAKNVPGMAQYCASKSALQHWGTIAAMEVPAGSGSRVISVVPYAVLTDVVRVIMERDPEEVPLVNYFREVEAAGEFATPESCAEHIWSAIESAENGAIVPVGALVIAQRA